MSANPLRRSPRTKDTYMSYLRKALLTFSSKDLARPWNIEDFIQVVRGKVRIRVTGLQSCRVDTCLRTSIDQLLEQGLILHDSAQMIRFLNDSPALNDFLKGSKAGVGETQESVRGTRAPTTGYKRHSPRSSPRKKADRAWYDAHGDRMLDENRMVIDSRRTSLNSDVDMGAPVQEARTAGLGVIIEEPVKFEGYQMMSPGPSRLASSPLSVKTAASSSLSTAGSWVLVQPGPSDACCTPGVEGAPMVISPSAFTTSFRPDPSMLVDTPKRPEFDHAAIARPIDTSTVVDVHHPTAVGSNELQTALRQKETELDNAEQSLKQIHVAYDKLDRVYQHLERQYCKLRYPHHTGPSSSSSLIDAPPPSEFSHLTTAQLVMELLERAWNKLNDAKLGRHSKETERKLIVDAVAALRHQVVDLRAQMNRCQLEDAAAQGLLRLGMSESSTLDVQVSREAERLPDRVQTLECVRGPDSEGQWREHARKWVSDTLGFPDGAAAVSSEMVQVVQVALQAERERESLQAAADAAAEMYLQLASV